jgi:hypothetical protein
MALWRSEGERIAAFCYLLFMAQFSCGQNTFWLERNATHGAISYAGAAYSEEFGRFQEWELIVCSLCFWV